MPGGLFATAGGIAANNVARWDGAAWSPLGAGLNASATALTTLPNGDLVASGDFTTAGGVPVDRIARWNGASWSPLGTGLDGGALGLATLQNGELVLGGSFTIVDGAVSAYLARLATTCPATVSVQGAGCTGSVGANVLAPLGLPWLGTTFPMRATGMPSLGLVVAVTGLSTLSLPLSAVLSQGQLGCALLVSPELLDVRIPVAGIATSQLVLPNAPALVGQVFHHQMVPLELGASAAILAATSTNAITATIGVF